MPRARQKKPEAEGAPAWVVTYGDMMSLLLCFFVLLLSFSTISEEAFKEALLSLQGALGVLPAHSSVVATYPRTMRQRKEEMEQAARRLQRQLLIQGKERQVKIEMDAQGGLKINLPSAILFDIGSATLRADAFPVLRDVAQILAELPDTFIEVRGHSDSQPLRDTVRFRDNYDLSYARADAVARQLMRVGEIPIDQFEIISCGSSQPVATNATEEGRNANRRVEIYVRGLVDRRKIELLQGESETLEESEAPGMPVSPRQLTDLR